jgi:hypothetical protein
MARFRPTEAQRFPSDPLSKALDQARALYKIAQNIAVPIPAASKAWGFTEKSSGGPTTVSCLKMFGLLLDNGSGAARRVKLSDDTIKIIRDPREMSSERDNLVRETALRPPLFRQIIDHFEGGLPPSDEALKTYLIFDVGLRDESVNDCMRVFADTMAFAKIAGSATIPEVADSNSRNGAPERPDGKQHDIPPPTKPKVGDYVQWTSGGVDQFRVPRKIVGIFPDGQHVQVFGSNTGVPMDELTVVDASAAMPTPSSVTAPTIDASSAGRLGDNDFTVLQRGNRLQITADVDLEGITTLKEMLSDYESILLRLAGKK